jgi:protein-S-isoprenylcysteine O-methyltransferase Ste14
MQALENKIPPPIIVAVCAAGMWGLSFTGPVIELSADVRDMAIIVLLVSGAFYGFAGALAFKKAATTVNPLRPEKASSLVSSGIYRVSRNPMYAGLALFLTAWAVYLSSAWAYLGVIGFVLYINRFQIAPEERALLKIFRSEYEHYQAKVRRWL